jgi:hypothetical protein
MKDQKNERRAKLSQKVEDDTVFKRLKDGQKHIRKSRWHKNTKSERWAKLSLKVKRLVNLSEEHKRGKIDPICAILPKVTTTERLRS